MSPRLSRKPSAVSNQEIDLSWSADPSGNSAGYNIYRSTSPSVTPSDENLIDFGVTGTTYQDTGLDSSAAYYYLVTSANSADVESSPSNQASATTSAAQLSATGQTITPTEGEEFDGAVASFTDTDVNADASNYTATIAWGDGDTSDATIQLNPTSGFDVTGSHAYKQYGTNPITVTINAADGRSITASGTANVQDAAIELESTDVSAVLNASTGMIKVASLTDANPNANAHASDFTATINWGDGNSSDATISQIGPGEFSVSGENTYASAGSFTLAITVVDNGGSAASGQATADVSPPFTTIASISDGTVQLGPDYVGEMYMPLYYLPSQTGVAGSDFDQWGVADSISGVGGGTGYGGENVAWRSLTSTATTASLLLDVGSTFELSESFAPSNDLNGSPVPDLYEVSATVRNISSNTVDLRYRNVVKDDTGDYVSMHAGDPEVVYDSNDGGVTTNPLSAQTSGSNPPADTPSGSFSQFGPWWSSGMFDFDFGALAPDAASTFTLYYGAAPNFSNARSDLSQDGINTWYISQPEVLQTGDPDNNAPTFIFGFKPGPQISADMQVDANNDGTVNSADEPIKDESNLPGKVIVANTLDETGSNKPGYADFNSKNALYTMPLDLSNIDYSKARIRFEYSAADPSLVNEAHVDGNDIEKFDPGSTGYLRLWTTSGASGARKPASVLDNGNYIPPDTDFPASDLTFDQSGSAKIYVEGVNPTDPKSTEVQVEIDPTGTGDWAVLDAARFTVGSVQLVYTDASGLSHADNGNILPVPRIPADQQPDGVAADWKDGVDDGSLLVLRVVGSPAVAALANQQHYFDVTWGAAYDTSGLTNLASDDGQVHSLTDGFVSNAAADLQQLGIENVGQTWGSTNMTVLAAELYRPPSEFDLASGTDDNATFRRVDVGVTVSIDGAAAVAGGKPQGLMITRPPLVLVHGINSGPGVWFDTNGGIGSFVDAMEGAGYPTTFEVDHTGIDPKNPTNGVTQGEGEISDMYLDVETEIGYATEVYREGTYFPSNPYALAAPGAHAPPGALIAVQKVDVVAHSYGGLLTRWYVEQSPEYPPRRDVRDVFELGTPNLGSPLANMVDEIYADPFIASARADGIMLLHIAPTVPTMRWALDFAASQGFLPTAAPGGTSPQPFFQDASVGSARMNSLNATPFNNDVGYAAAIGENNVMTSGLSWVGASVNLYSALQPMWYPLTAGAIQLSAGLSYFPWMSAFDGGDKQTDGVVPVWSASLGVAAYNFYVENANHVQLVQNPQVQQQVVAWLADPNVPLGSGQRAAWQSQPSPGNQPPVNDRNAYQGAKSVDLRGNLTGGGLSPNAIVGVQFDGTGYGPAAWDTSAANVGIHVPALTGMIKIGDIADNIGHNFTIVDENNMSVLDQLGSPVLSLMGITSDELSGATVNDWVAFRLTTGMLGRRHAQILIGPNGKASYLGVADVGYTMADLPDGKSPPTLINLPSFSLAAPVPTVSGGIIHLALSGAVEWQNPASGSQTNQIDIYANSGDRWLQAWSANVVPPPGAWDGLLLPYSTTVDLTYDSSGNPFGSQGDSGIPHPQVYQYLHERWSVPNTSSATVTL